jgi:PPIC-type PPIASE domain
MLRNLCLSFIFGASSLLAQQPGTAPNAQTSQTPATAVRPPLPVQPQQQVPPNAPVVTIHGLCPAEKPTIGQKTEACTVVLTRSQFEGMVHAINLTNQSFNPVALRSMANGYVTLMALADAGEKAGLEKDPRFHALMDVARTRALAETYHQYLEEKYATPSEAEIEEYYKQNTSKYEVSHMQRILIPKVNPLRSLDKPAEFEKKAHALADQIRERAAKGEDIFSLQAEAYKTLAIKTMPPQTEMNPVQVRLLPKPVQADVEALKPGEVSKVEVESSGFNIYKLSSRKTLSLEEAKPQIVRELAQRNIDTALKAVTGAVHTDFNEEFFSARGGARPPQLPGLPLRPGTQMNVHPIPAPASAPTASGATNSSPAGRPSSSPK